MPTQKKKLINRPEILVAIITVTGTIIAALISAPWIVGIIGKPTIFPAPTIELLLTTPTVEQIPVRLDVMPPSDTNPNVGFCNDVIIPSDLNPLADPAFAYQELEARQYHAAKNISKQLLMNGTYAELTVTSLVNQEWVRLANRIMAKVVNYEAMPGTLDVLPPACGGTGTMRKVTGFEVNSTSDIFVEKVPDVDFFTLQPGEFEVFTILLSATEPGRYEINLGVEYTYKGTTSELWSDQSVFVYTPETFRGWGEDYSSKQLQHFINGKFQNGTYTIEFVK